MFDRGVPNLWAARLAGEAARAKRAGTQRLCKGQTTDPARLTGHALPVWFVTASCCRQIYGHLGYVYVMSQSYEGDPVGVNKASDVNQAETRLFL